MYITAVAMIAGILRLDETGFSVCEYLFMDFHALMNNEIFYSYQPLYLRAGIQALSESELCELDHLAELLADPDKNMEQIEHLRASNEKLSDLTNNTQNIYYDAFLLR